MPADVLFFPNLSAGWPNAGYVISGHGYAGGWKHSPAALGLFALDAGIAVVDDVQYLPTVGEMAFFVDKTPQSLPVFSLRTSVYAAGIDMGKFTYQIVLDVYRSAFCQLLVVGGIAIGRSKSEDMYGTYLL